MYKRQVGLYAPLAEFAGAGASVPLLGFGHLLAKGVRTAVAEKGAINIHITISAIFLSQV